VRAERIIQLSQVTVQTDSDFASALWRTCNSAQNLTLWGWPHIGRQRPVPTRYTSLG